MGRSLNEKLYALQFSEMRGAVLPTFADVSCTSSISPAPLAKLILTSLRLRPSPITDVTMGHLG